MVSLKESILTEESERRLSTLERIENDTAVLQRHIEFARDVINKYLRGEEISRPERIFYFYAKSLIDARNYLITPGAKRNPRNRKKFRRAFIFGKSLQEEMTEDFDEDEIEQFTELKYRICHYKNMERAV
jgi:hypothetical protein